MSLEKYRQKRKFDKSPEPEGKATGGRGPLRFVVQKHQAARLHYDFRLELGGTLKSWAVPKGPSLNPKDKRLAIIVEDHPLDYRTFEGVIPAGNYGAGTVMIWDEGTYHTPQTADRAACEKILQKDLQDGHLRVVLQGKKLKGEFSLVKLQNAQKNAWLLLKKRDEFAAGSPGTEMDRSAATHRTMDEIARQAARSDTVWQSKPHTALPDLSDAPKSKFPTKVRPMLATLVEEPFDRPGWIFEIKWDGYRAIAEVRKERVRLYSRNQLSFEQRFRPLVESLKKLGHEAVLDGEVVVLDEAGKPRFQLLQNYQKTGQGQLAYYAFDLLYLDGHDLRDLPLVRRKELLQAILGHAPSEKGVRHLLPERPGGCFAQKVPDPFFAPNIRLSEHVEERGIAFFEAVCQQGLEGMVAKNGASLYREGHRSHAWLKIKTHLHQEAVIGGFTKGRGSRKHFGALVLGVYEGDRLVYVGHTGGGFSGKDLADIYSRLEPLVQSRCPFGTSPQTNAPVRWVRPELVCEVAFREWSSDGHMREPIFLGLREDMAARSVRREQPERVGEVRGKQPNVRRRQGPDNPTSTNQLRESGKRDTDLAIGGHAVHLTNLGKLYWPQEGYTKGDLIRYYREVAPFILPYLRDRPQALHRHPNGITGKGFFQKDVRDQPEWVQTVPIHSESGGKDIRYLVCQDEATLVYLANLGCIELNPWSSRLGSLDRPDYLVIDLDPENVPFSQVVDAALAVRRTLEGAGGSCYCKTSGKRGLHVYVPLAARYDYDQARQFAQIIASLVHAELPQLTSVVRSPAKRQQKVYLDFLQNRRGQTLAAPYAVRPHPGATVSTPLKWPEVRRHLDPAKFTMRTMARRLDKTGDLWRPVLGPGIDLEQCLDRLLRSGLPGRRRDRKEN